MLQASRADLSQTFCTYCGYPPMGPWCSRAHRVCMRCEMGTVLRAPPGLQPRFDEPFVIVDQRLRVQAVSRRAEAVLGVDEPAAFDSPLEELLVSRNGDRGHKRIAALVEDAVAGSTRAKTIELRTTFDPLTRFVTRVAACGPPAAALLVLTPVEGRRRKRRAATNGRTVVNAKKDGA
jgi:hypothetical protein